MKRHVYPPSAESHQLIFYFLEEGNQKVREELYAGGLIDLLHDAFVRGAENKRYKVSA